MIIERAAVSDVHLEKKIDPCPSPFPQEGEVADAPEL
jgi:hypothetical protein